MSDHDDNERLALIAHLVEIYDALHTVCAALPVPISLPWGDITDIASLLASVTRVVDLLEDQPMPEEQQAYLLAGVLHWLAAADLIGLAGHDGGKHARKYTAAINLHQCEQALLPLATWLADNGDRE